MVTEETPHATHYLEKPPVGGFKLRGYTLFRLGDEGNWLVTFDQMSDTQFLALCTDFEEAEENYDSGTTYDLTWIEHRRVVLLRDRHYPDDWSIHWDYKKYPSADILVTMLTRW